MLAVKAPYSAKYSIAVIGAGWNGIHIARKLAEKYPKAQIDLYEASSRICDGISNDYGSRTHKGGCHYLRSKATRDSCTYGYERTLKEYSDLLVDTESIYGLAKRSDDGRMPRVTKTQFMSVFDELDSYSKVKLEEYGFQNLETAVNIKEPTFKVGEPRRRALQKRLDESKVNLLLNARVTKLDRDEKNNEILLESRMGTRSYRHVINTTCFKALVDTHKALPFNMNVRYQLRLSLIYEDTQPPKSKKPISFIALDGLYISLLPINDETESAQKYMLTHGKHTTLGAYDTYREAIAARNSLDKDIVHNIIRTRAENDPKTGANHFITDFSDRFKFKGYKTAILPAMMTERDFRSSVVFQDDQTGIITSFPGKLSNVFEVEKEVIQLIDGDKVSRIPGYICAKDGALLRGKSEITEEIRNRDLNTCNQDTLRQIKSKIRDELSIAMAKHLSSNAAKIIIPIGLYQFFVSIIKEETSPFVALAATCAVVIAAGILPGPTRNQAKLAGLVRKKKLTAGKVNEGFQRMMSGSRLFSPSPEQSRNTGREPLRLEIPRTGRYNTSPST